MKKVIRTEIVILILLVVLALVLTLCVPKGALGGAQSQPQTSDTPTTEETEPSTTEPEPTWITVPADRELTAKQAFVYDCQSQSFAHLVGTEEEQVYPASITKLFTAYVALQFLEPDREVVALDALELVGPGSSVAQIEKGDVLTVEQLVEGMLLPSGNDAAYLLAVETGRVISEDPTMSASVSTAIFMAEMNRQAQSLGMTGTQFLNPDGYHEDGHYTNFRDLATLAKVALENETILRYSAISSDIVNLASGQKQWTNTNALVDPESPHYCPYAVGLKTGQTPSAGSCLLSAFDVKGHMYIIGVFGCPDVEDRFDDTLQLLSRVLEQ